MLIQRKTVDFEIFSLLIIDEKRSIFVFFQFLYELFKNENGETGQAGSIDVETQCLYVHQFLKQSN